MGRDGYEVAASDPRATAHGRIDRLLDAIAADPPGVYSDRLDVTSYPAGAAIAGAPMTERAETAAAALARYTARKREYTGGIYSPDEYTEHDYCNVVSRLAQLLLRKKLTFETLALVALVTEVADHAARNVRTYPIKGLLAQVEHHVKQQGSLPTGLVAPLQTIVDVLAAETARSRPHEPPAIVREVGKRAKALLTTRAT